MPIELSLATADYDHVRDLADGAVRVEGVDLLALRLPAPEIFARFLRAREWDVSELSFAKYVALRASGDDELTAIPVFLSRAFRHDALFVRSDGPHNPRALRGARIGVPEWAQTAAVWTRDLLAHEWDVPLDGVEWVQAGLNDAGRAEKVALSLPDGVRVRREPDRSLNELLRAGELDAIVSAHPPAGALEGSLVRMPSGGEEVEREYRARTGVFPIMHVVVLPRMLAVRHRWLPANLLRAFTEAKDRSLERIADRGVSRLPLPGAGAQLSRARDAAGGDPWPYGIAANRPTLTAFLRACAEQGVASRLLDPEELFDPGVRDAVRL